jgi:hypothetical protein
MGKRLEGIDLTWESMRLKENLGHLSANISCRGEELDSFFILQFIIMPFIYFFLCFGRNRISGQVRLKTVFDICQVECISGIFHTRNL